jgi:diguanylate cyclase (GGDEF)-like protein
MERTPPMDSVWPEAAPSTRAIQGSLARRMVMATLLFGLVFTVAAVGARMWSAWRTHVDAMTAELGLIDQVFQRTLAKAVWEMDRDSVRTQLDSAANVTAVGAIELRVDQPPMPAQVQRAGRSPAQGSTLAPTLRRELNYSPYPGAVNRLGELVIVGDEQVLWRRLRDEAASIVLTQAIQTLLLAGLVMWMFNRSVTVHVREVARHLGRLTPARLSQPLRLGRRRNAGDELDLLESGVNDLQDKLSRYLDRQQRYEHDLAAHRDRLAELVAEQTAELVAANQRLEDLSRSDPLTGLANRRHFDEMKEVEFRRAQRTGQPLSVLMCDVDHFKHYNDVYGHAAGDQCLLALARVLRDNFARAGELVARLGGEEFVVLLPGVDLPRARQAAERLLRRLQEQALPHEGVPTADCVTLSVGVATFDPETMDRFDQLLSRADQALYRAKDNGRHQVAA